MQKVAFTNTSVYDVGTDLMPYMLATVLVKEIWNLKISQQNAKCQFKNNICTHIRLVCIYFDAFYLLNPNIAMTI